MSMRRRIGGNFDGWDGFVTIEVFLGRMKRYWDYMDDWDDNVMIGMIFNYFDEKLGWKWDRWYSMRMMLEWLTRYQDHFDHFDNWDIMENIDMIGNMVLGSLE